MAAANEPEINMNLYKIRIIAGHLHCGGRKHWGECLELIASSEAEALARAQAHLVEEAHPWAYRVVDAEDMGPADMIRSRGSFTMKVAEFREKFPHG